MFNCKPAAVAVFSAILFATPAFAGPEWIEIGDAGSKYDDAQKTFGSGDLTGINGNLLGFNSFGDGGGDFEDMYLVSVTDPGAFMISIDANFDAQLWIFNITLPGEAFGLLGNDNTNDGFSPVLTPMATDGTGAQLTLPGIYAIAVSGAGRVPVSMNGNIFNFVSSTEVSGPDGPGGLNPHTGWTGEGEIGSYILTLEGVGFYDLPEPGAMALIGLAAMIARRRRIR